MVKAILIDALSTIFRLKQEISKYQMLNNFYKELLGEEIPVSRIKEVYDVKRKELEAAPGTDYLLKWTLINKEIIMELWPNIKKARAEELGHAISYRVCADASLYQVDADTKNFLKKTKKRGIIIIIASNQDAGCLKKLVESFKLSKMVDKVYSSSELGLEKPDRRFFETILGLEGLKAKDCAMIGNNIKNDVLGAQAVGIAGILLDPKNLNSDYRGCKISKFKELWQLDIFKGA